MRDETAHAAGRWRSWNAVECRLLVGAIDRCIELRLQYSHMIVTVEFPPGASFGDVKKHLECLGGPDDYVVRVMHERVFRFMHRI